MHVHGGLCTPECWSDEGEAFPGAGVAGGVVHCLAWVLELNSGSLQEQCVLLTTEPPL